MEKTLKLITILLFIICGSAYAAGEVQVGYPSGQTLYFIIRENDGDVFYPTSDTFEVWGGGAGRAMADYDIALTDKSGGIYVGTFDPDIAAGTYQVQALLRIGGAPADTDPAIGTVAIEWSGSAEIVLESPANYKADVSALATAAALATHDGKLDTIDGIVDSILADTDELQTNQGNFATATGFATAAALATHDAKLDTVDDYVDTEIAAIKARTDNLPGDPADASDISASFAALNDTSAPEFVTALMGDTGITAGGSYTFEDFIKSLGAYSLGTWRDKDGSPGTIELLDWEDDTTVIIEMTSGSSTPYKETTKQ